MNAQRPPYLSPTRQQGLTLVEIMVSLAIGLVVIGAVFANYINNSAGSKQSAALAQVTEDATLALGILRNHLAMADYSLPTASTANRMLRRLDGQLNLLGCNNGFASGTLSNTQPTTVTCAANAATADQNSGALLVRYEADADTLPVATNAAGETGPIDCSGNTLLASTDASGNFFIADNRFFVDKSVSPPVLRCMGRGGTTNAAPTFVTGAQPLVENIEQLVITYGRAAMVNNRPGSANQYVSASDVAEPGVQAPGVVTTEWARVVSVRICVLVQSAENVLDAPTPFRNCNGTIVTPPASDHRIHRAFTSTVVLSNRASLTPGSGGAANPPNASSGT